MVRNKENLKRTSDGDGYPKSPKKAKTTKNNNFTVKPRSVSSPKKVSFSPKLEQYGKTADKSKKIIKKNVDLGKPKGKKTIPVSPKQPTDEELKEDVKEKLCEMKFKDRKICRKKTENLSYDRAHSSKKIWEELRREDCAADTRLQLVSKLMNIVKGHVKELIFAHDTVRVIECLLTHANAEQRSNLFNELKDCILLLAQKKYSKFFLLKFLRCGTKEEKNAILETFYGNVVKSIRHTESASVLEMAYNEHAKANQRMQLVQEFYGPTFSLFKDPEIKSLNDAIIKLPAQKDSILTHVNEILIKLTDKSVVRHSMIHHVLREYLTLADAKGRAEVIEAYKEVLPEILHTKDGSRCAMMCLWHGTAKDRKAIIKSLKTLVVKTAKEEHGCMVLLAIFDCVDDTRLIEKSVINELLPSIKELVFDPHGRKVLLYLIRPRDSLHFHPDIVAILKQGDGNEHSKKDANARRKELRTIISKPLSSFVALNITDLLKMNFNCLFVLTVINGIDDQTEIFEAISNYILGKPYYPTQGNDIHPIEHPGCVTLLKKLLGNDKLEQNKDKTGSFSSILVSLALSGTLKTWAECNRGAFHLLRLLETNKPEVSSKLREELIGMHKNLSSKKYKGAELLLKELKRT